MKQIDITTWIAPTWHPSVGNAQEEFRMLKDFSLRLISLCDLFQVELECAEEGYMYVSALRNSLKVAELYVVDRNSRMMYGLFVFTHDGGEFEFYFDDIAEGIKYLMSHHREA